MCYVTATPHWIVNKSLVSYCELPVVSPHVEQQICSTAALQYREERVDNVGREGCADEDLVSVIGGEWRRHDLVIVLLYDDPALSRKGNSFSKKLRERTFSESLRCLVRYLIVILHTLGSIL